MAKAVRTEDYTLLKDLPADGYYWFRPDPGSEHGSGDCVVEVCHTGFRDTPEIFFTGTDVGYSLRDVAGTFEPVRPPFWQTAKKRIAKKRIVPRKRVARR